MISFIHLIKLPVKTGKNLNWYWKPWFFERGYPDLGIKKVEKDGDSYKMIRLTFVDALGNDTTITRTAAVWENNTEVLVEAKIKGDIKIINLGGDAISDVNSKNDSYKVE